MVSKGFVTLGVTLRLTTVKGEHGRDEPAVQLTRGEAALQTWYPKTTEHAKKEYSAIETMLVLLEAIELMRKGAH